jgi:hypothetical protein
MPIEQTSPDLPTVSTSDTVSGSETAGNAEAASNFERGLEDATRDARSQNGFGGSAGTHQPARTQVAQAAGGSGAKPAPGQQGPVDPKLREIVDRAVAQGDPEAALKELSLGYASAAPALKKAILNDPAAQDIMKKVAAYVNDAFTGDADKSLTDASRASARLHTATKDVDPEIAAAVADRAFQGHEQDYRAVLRSGNAATAGAEDIVRKGRDALPKVLQHIAGTPAASRLTAPAVDERTLVAEIQKSFPNRSSPEAVAFNKLIGSKDFRSLEPDARIAVLSQVKNYPNAASIKTLGEMSGRTWFSSASLPDKQRFAKLFAEFAQFSGDAEIQGYTLDDFFERNGPKVEWSDNLGKATAEYQQEKGRKTILLDRNEVSADNDPLAGKDALNMSHNALFHEVCHMVNGHGKAGGKYADFMEEYRGWFVAFRGQNRRDPTKMECFDRLQQLADDQQGYPLIATNFNDPNSTEGKKMVAFTARALNVDHPDTVTARDVFGQAKNLNEPGLAPVSTGPTDKNILNNRRPH